ncbi:unnamed protein product [Mesocestoides corti]|nr:unnamed protein product [Mesocestoides corti]
MATTCKQVDYGYGSTNGPHTWCLTCSAAAGARQSPINIVRHRCVEDLSLGSIKIVSLQNVSELFTRKKHNFQVSFANKKASFVEGGPLKGRYYLQQFHCHWGCEDGWGSEHQIDGRSFGGELHLVFMNEKHNSIEEATRDSEGLCVIGVFFKVDNTENLQIKPLIDVIKSSKPNSEQPINEYIDVKHLIPSLSRYFTYEGSLTTPPCAECVRWIICAEPLRISTEQLAAMRTMHCCNDCNTNENFRPPLPLGKRKVTCSFSQNLH